MSKINKNNGFKATKTNTTVADPGFSERGGCLLFLTSLTGKIIAEKSKYRGVATPITPPLNPPLHKANQTQTDGQKDRQTNGQTDEQTDRHTDKN